MIYTMSRIPQEVVRGFAPGVDASTNTFTCPRCRVSRDCQALNPVCLSCGYQDPRRFELSGGDYLVADSPRGPWRSWRKLTDR
jgi:hypothetical protein